MRPGRPRFFRGAAAFAAGAGASPAPSPADGPASAGAARVSGGGPFFFRAFFGVASAAGAATTETFSRFFFDFAASFFGAFAASFFGACAAFRTFGGRGAAAFRPASRAGAFLRAGAGEAVGLPARFATAAARDGFDDDAFAPLEPRLPVDTVPPAGFFADAFFGAAFFGAAFFGAAFFDAALFGAAFFDAALFGAAFFGAAFFGAAFFGAAFFGAAFFGAAFFGAAFFGAAFFADFFGAAFAAAVFTFPALVRTVFFGAAFFAAFFAALRADAAFLAVVVCDAVRAADFFAPPRAVATFFGAAFFRTAFAFAFFTAAFFTTFFFTAAFFTVAFARDFGDPSDRDEPVPALDFVAVLAGLLFFTGTFFGFEARDTVSAFPARGVPRSGFPADFPDFVDPDEARLDVRLPVVFLTAMPTSRSESAGPETG